MAEIMLLGFITVRKIRNCGMFMVNNIGFKGCKSEKTGCRNLLAVAVGGL